MLVIGRCCYLLVVVVSRWSLLLVVISRCWSLLLVIVVSCCCWSLFFVVVVCCCCLLLVIVAGSLRVTAHICATGLPFQSCVWGWLSQCEHTSIILKLIAGVLTVSFNCYFLPFAGFK